MTRRRRSRRGRGFGWGWPLLAAVVAVWWAWQTHPVAVLVCAALAAPAAYGLWRARRAWRMRKGEETVLYRHYFSDGTPLYYGITNRYELRCGQHEDGSWWWYFIEPSLSTNQVWPNRAAAERAETAAIRRDCPIGNTRDNPAWAAQQPRRRELQAQAGRARVYRQPPPVQTMPTARRPLTGSPWAGAGRGLWGGRRHATFRGAR